MQTINNSVRQFLNNKPCFDGISIEKGFVKLWVAKFHSNGALAGFRVFAELEIGENDTGTVSKAIASWDDTKLCYALLPDGRPVKVNPKFGDDLTPMSFEELSTK